MMDKQVRGVLNQQVSIEKVKSEDGRGNITYEDPVVMPCYISGETKMIRDEEGRERVSDRTLYINGSEEASNGDLIIIASDITHSDRITLTNGTKPPIKRIVPFYSERGHLSVLEVNL